MPYPHADRTPTKAAVSPGGRALPLTPVGTSAPADLGGQFAAAAASAESPRLLQPTISDAAAAAQAVAASAPPVAAVPAAPKPSLNKASPAAAQQAAVQQAAAPQQQAAKPAGGGAAAVGPPEEAKKSMKEMSKAERRALQEAQRAAKAAAKAGAQPAAAAGGAGGKQMQKQGSGNNLARQGRQPSDVKDAAKAAAGGDSAGKGGKGAGGAAKGGAAGQKAAADAFVPPAKLMAMFAHLPVPRGVTLQSIAQQKGPPGGRGRGRAAPAKPAASRLSPGCTSSSCLLRPMPAAGQHVSHQADWTMAEAGHLAMSPCRAACCSASSVHRWLVAASWASVLLPLSLLGCFRAPRALFRPRPALTPCAAVPLVAAKLGLRYADGSLRGGNARCIAMLQMFVQCIQVGCTAGRALSLLAYGMQLLHDRQLWHCILSRLGVAWQPRPLQLHGGAAAGSSVALPSVHCWAALHAMPAHAAQDFRTPAGREFAKEFSPALNNIINFLVGAGAAPMLVCFPCRLAVPAGGRRLRAPRAEHQPPWAGPCRAFVPPPCHAMCR